MTTENKPAILCRNSTVLSLTVVMHPRKSQDGDPVSPQEYTCSLYYSTLLMGKYTFALYNLRYAYAESQRMSILHVPATEGGITKDQGFCDFICDWMMEQYHAYGHANEKKCQIFVQYCKSRLFPSTENLMILDSQIFRLHRMNRINRNTREKE